jgi:hypothetical protein
VTAVYRRNPAPAPDADFDPGAIEHLVAGNVGRVLDPRRTPVTVVAADARTGFFTVRIDDFEDAGATWDVPLESVRLAVILHEAGAIFRGRGATAIARRRSQ